MALAGFFLETRFVTIMALPVEIMSKKEVGIAGGLVLSVGFIGGVSVSLIAGRILDLSGSLDRALLILIGVSIAAAAVAFRLPETGPRARGKKGRVPGYVKEVNGDY